MKLKHYVSDYPKHKRMHSAALRRPAVMPLKGDGYRASNCNYWHSRYEGYRGHHYFKPPSSAEARARLVEARYADWLAARDAALGPLYRDAA